MSDHPTDPAPADETVPAWYAAALGELGVREYTPQHPGPHGEQSNPRVEEYQRVAGQRHPDDEVSWCASFVSWCLAQAHEPHLGTGARSYEHYGVKTVARVGAIAVLWREDPHGTRGHVGFYVGPDPHDPQAFIMLSGNSANMVQMHPYPLSRLLAFRWPA